VGVEITPGNPGHLKSFHVTILEMATCKAIVQEGPRKGESCMFPPSDNGYCGRHERNREYDEGITEGKVWCRYFFRGCSTELTTQEVDAKEVSCKPCREKLTKKKHPCEHEGCPFKVLEAGFCKKHERDKYKKEEQEKGIRYCDIARGCFTICTGDKKSCQECLDKTRIVDTKRYQKRKELAQVLQTTTHTSQRVCTKCGKDFEMFKTRYGKESLLCTACNANQAKQDDKRRDRLRNYNHENNQNIQGYFKAYVSSATKRGYEMNIDFETFSELVVAPCYYCGHHIHQETNGIDRVDNSKGYSKENCVTACWKCNKIKYIYNLEFLVDKCKILTKQLEVNDSFYKKWKMYYYRTSYRNYGAYKQEAEGRGLPFEITPEQWTWLTRSPCYLCSYKSPKGIGIDRVDNTIRAYTFENCRPCCGSCNLMKGEFNLNEFIDHCKKIVEVCPRDTVVPFHDPLKEVIAKGGLMKAEVRKHWKALGLYYAIVSDTAEAFLDSYSDVYTKEEFEKLCGTIKTGSKENAITSLQKLIQNLKKRKQRASGKS
jgi:hypothetical protein